MTSSSASISSRHSSPSRPPMLYRLLFFVLAIVVALPPLSAIRRSVGCQGSAHTTTSFDSSIPVHSLARVLHRRCAVPDAVARLPVLHRRRTTARRRVDPVEHADLPAVQLASRSRHLPATLQPNRVISVITSTTHGTDTSTADTLGCGHHDLILAADRSVGPVRRVSERERTR